jgi:hypothetical protein
LVIYCDESKQDLVVTAQECANRVVDPANPKLSDGILVICVQDACNWCWQVSLLRFPSSVSGRRKPMPQRNLLSPIDQWLRDLDKGASIAHALSCCIQGDQ